MALKKLVLTPFFLLLLLTASAQVKLPRIIRDSMILQRDVPVKIWGEASVNEKIQIRFNGRKYNTKADNQGRWQLTLPATPAGGPYTLNIYGKNQIQLKEILFGDVWVFSGQSNMVHQLNIHDIAYAKEIAEANFPMIRQFLVPVSPNLAGPAEDLSSGSWNAAVGEDVRPFSVIAYFFAKVIHERYNIPVGIINASVGGTPARAWISEEGLSDFPDLQTVINKNKDTAYVNSFNRIPVMMPQRSDKGLMENPVWYALNYIPKGWRNINIPGYWEDQGIKDLNGTVWYRREIELPVSMTAKPARLFMGRIVDADEVFINGKRVGNTTYQYPQRRYHIGPDILKPGKNLFVIRVTNNFGKGGFVPDKPYYIISGQDTIDLKGYWQYKVGEVFRPIRSGNMAGGLSHQNQPAALYNGMIAPFTNYTIKGFNWYQGESDAGNPETYKQLMSALINDWRLKWKQDTLPFLFVQLPGFMEYNYLPSESNWALMREAQLGTLELPNTGMAVAIDLGEWNDIHPGNKDIIGRRLATAALHVAYGEDLIHSGPVYHSSTIDKNKIKIRFSHTGSGLTTSDGESPASFAIAGEDKNFIWAQAKIEGDAILVWSDEVRSPKYVRYAWADNPLDPNLVNKEGLPASPFRTDK